MAKRSDRVVPKRSGARIWSKHSRPLTPAVVSEQPEKRARIPETPASVNPETFAMIARVRRQLGDVHRVECCSPGFA